MRLCCCRRRTPNRVEEADTKTRNQETLHYTHRDGVVTVTREYSHPSLGNASGIFLRSLLTSNLFFCGEWEIVAHNIDDDVEWCGPGDVAWSLLEHLKSIAAKE